MTIRTWAQQLAYESEIRRSWLEQVASKATTYAEAAAIADHDRGCVHRLFKSGGVQLTPKPVFKTTREKPAPKPIEPAKLLRIKNAAARARDMEMLSEIRRRKDMLMAEGYSEQVALRAIEHQLGAG